MIYFTPGPSELYPTIKYHLQAAIENNIASLSHRSEKFRTIYRETAESLRRLLDIPRDFNIFFVSSATEAMEIAARNCVEKYSAHFVDGAFGEKFFEIARAVKKESVKLNIGEIEKIPRELELICFTHSETSTGTYVPLENIYETRKNFPRALIAVDIVSSVPYVDLDFKMVDFVFFSVQKGFGLPAGLGIIIANQKAIDKANYLQNKSFDIGGWNNLPALAKKAASFETPATPNVLNIYLLGKICEDLKKIGVQMIRKEIDTKARMVYNAFDRHPTFNPAIKDGRVRSQTVITIDTGRATEEMVGKLAANGFVMGRGYGDKKNSQIRIANFPAHQIGDLKKMLDLFLHK